jgi:hypothetical protein
LKYKIEPGEPSKRRAHQAMPPLNCHRWVADAVAVEGVEQKAKALVAQVHAHRELSSSVAA